MFVVLFVMLIGLLGVFLPILPGIELIWLAALGYGILHGFTWPGVFAFAGITLLLIAGIFLLVITIAIAPGASFGAFIDYPSLMVVIGGSIAAVLVCFPLKSLLNTGRVMRNVFFNKPEDITALIEQIVSLADEGEVGQPRNAPDLLQVVELARCLQGPFQFGR